MEADREFLQFSDKLRLHATGTASLSLGDTIWSSDSFDLRRNPDASSAAPPPPQSGEPKSFLPWISSGQKLAFNDGKKGRFNNLNTSSSGIDAAAAAAAAAKGHQIPFDKRVNGGNFVTDFKGASGKQANSGHGGGRKSNNGGGGSVNHAGKKKNESNDGAAAEKWFKTLPPSESLPRSEAIGGYIFVCNNDTMLENLQRQLFGLPQRYRDSVRAITPGLPIFLYNYTTHQLHGVFEAASFGGTNIDPAAWEDKKKNGESRFPAQVRVMTRKVCEALEEDTFRPILHHYDGPKFRLELSVPEALDLLDKFEEADRLV